MRVLAIETASEACSIALTEGAAMLAHDHRVMARGHAEALVPMIGALPDKGRADRILVSLGPGSFTGVRIGLATARALGFAWGAEVLGYPTLALIAAQAQALHPGEPVTVCMNGGHGEWFVQDFGADGLTANELSSMAPAAAMAAGARNLIAGNRAEDFAALLGDARQVVTLLPDAAQVGLVPDALLTTHLAPIYGRGADATPMALRKPA
ncbi:tRNA threonylcarbamoyl adenosine modification protein YeaZ [Erythromicrobium ramosum]|uniref:tRNA (Adenosine(37)-N6)-threonylcarbamoyltransferase complex dimerization subunit type 1 TsaB n=1 Tax=Erythrobacter ramosus TaxID=35811 RepID=A0A6I4UK72_9SPHN|nr:tRNA (adenosine(37)-N6)-threonylcarbamoyltransferase complex dimerization subunit type 1 TsaB [Erythrobacter ramosus]MBB3775601.1 tRNA threonylcarbamoyl adenosine modification protein YeaZ [Erythrobacter ramosus]MXP39300.1 tRNA (adenosine(37)-N6)-threonylcarbamoyltransferase complex dimerization subunit type 1 TsaB [Erythrobacter ramosus]